MIPVTLPDTPGVAENDGGGLGEGARDVVDDRGGYEAGRVRVSTSVFRGRSIHESGCALYVHPVIGRLGRT